MQGFEKESEPLTSTKVDMKVDLKEPDVSPLFFMKHLQPIPIIEKPVIIKIDPVVEMVEFFEKILKSQPFPRKFSVDKLIEFENAFISI